MSLSSSMARRYLWCPLIALAFPAVVAGCSPSGEPSPEQPAAGARMALGQASVMQARVHIGDPGGGFIPVDDVVGKVFLTVWPPSRISVTDHPEAFDAIPAEPETATDEDSPGR